MKVENVQNNRAVEKRMVEIQQQERRAETRAEKRE